jgi:aspartate racemase
MAEYSGMVSTFYKVKDIAASKQQAKEVTFPFKRLGILGGMGVDATADLYSLINKLTREYIDVRTDQDYLSKRISDNPQVPDRSAYILHELGVSKEAAKDPFPYLLLALDDLVLGRMPAKILGMPCNTAHYFLPAMREYIKDRGYDAQIVDMIVETAKEVKDRYPNFKKVGLLATSATLQSRLYHSALADYGYEVITPHEEDQKRLVMEAIFGNGREKGIKAGFLKEPGHKIAEAANNLQNAGAQLIIAGCTEIPLVLKPVEGDAPLVNPTEVLARRMIEQAIA